MWLPRKREEEEYYKWGMLITDTRKVLVTNIKERKGKDIKGKEKKIISVANTLFWNEWIFHSNADVFDLETAVGINLLGCEQLKDQRWNQGHHRKREAEQVQAPSNLGQEKKSPVQKEK